MSKVNVDATGGYFKLGVDLNEDGENLAELRIKLSEALEEIVARDEPKEGVKIVEFKMDGTSLKLKLDTDKDGEELLDLTVDFGEVFDEASGAFKK